jgi:hypothetical protein
LLTFFIAVLLFPFILIIALVSVVFFSLLFLRAKKRAAAAQKYSRQTPGYKQNDGVEIEAKVEVLQKTRVREP